MRSWAMLTVGLLIAFILTGCASTQEMRNKRISKNQDIFNSFPPEVQQQVRQGQVNIGFSTDMVRLAWGAPDTVSTRTTQEAVTTVWRYTRTRYYPYYHHMSIPTSYIDSRGRHRIAYHSVWIDRHGREEYTVATIEFIRGEVSAIEQLH